MQLRKHDSSSRRRVIVCLAAVAFRLDQPQLSAETRQMVWWSIILSKRSPRIILSSSFSIRQGSRSESSPRACASKVTARLLHHRHRLAKEEVLVHRLLQQFRWTLG